MTSLGTLWIAYGFRGSASTCFWPRASRRPRRIPTPKSTILMVRSVPIAEFERMMLDGTIRDNCTLAAWGLYLLWKARQG